MFQLPNESLPRVVFSPGEWDQAKAFPVKGIKTTATVVRGNAPPGTEFPKVRFIQNLLSEGVRDVYYSDPERENPIKHLGIDGSGLNFPLLDANPNGDPLFYEQDFGSNGDDYFVYDSVPTLPGALSDYTDPVTGETRRQKFDRLILKADFKIFLVIEFDDGTVFPLGNIKWDLDGEMEAELDGSGPDKRTITIKKKTLNHDGQPTRSHDSPETMIPPYPNDVLQLQPQ